jgi:predicted Holliday junction resolvase-like endonuclease
MIIITWQAIAFFILLQVAIIWKYVKERKKYGEKVKAVQEKFGTLLSQKKSSEVRVGKIGENMAPFLKDWPYDPNRFRFLGNPVDGIQFTNDEIIFVEIKTGRSKLTKTQRSIRNLLRKEGTVSFATFRIDENGCTLKKDDNGNDDD